MQRPRDDKPNLMSQLGLSPEQMEQIRQINKQRKPRMAAAQERFRLANRALDEEIYGDTPNDADVDARVKEVQAAQSDLTALRAASELAVRRILTPEQLVRFRELRAKFEEMREMMQEHRKGMRRGHFGAPGENASPKRKPV